MLSILFTKCNERVEYHYNDTERVIANDKVKSLIYDAECTALKCILADGSVKIYKKEPEMCYAIVVHFENSTSPYTYWDEIDEDPCQPEDEVIVDVRGELKKVQVVSNNVVEKTALPSLCNGRKPQRIVGKLVKRKHK